MNKLENKSRRFDAMVVSLDDVKNETILHFASELVAESIETIVICPKESKISPKEESQILADFRKKIGLPNLFTTIHDTQEGVKKILKQTGFAHTVWLEGSGK